MAVIALFAAVPAGADETAPTTNPTSAPITEPTAGSEDGAIDVGGEVTRPNPDTGSRTAPRVLVFGDSISALTRYSLDGRTRPQVWWSHLAATIGVPARQVMVSAEGGSGLLAHGGGIARRQCSGSTFGDRLGDIAATNPDVVIVGVGRNDVHVCINRVRVPSTSQERRTAAMTYFADLARAVDRQGIRRSNVYVMSPWGSSMSSGHSATATLYEAIATARGFTWVATPALVRSQTTDTTHPNAVGSRAIAHAALRSSDIATAVKTRGARHTPVPSLAHVLCASLSRCRAQSIKTYSYAKATANLWGTRTRTDRHYVAHRLMHGNRRVAPILTASTARGWRVAAVTESAARQVAHAKVGDVAWWRTAPAGIGAASRGHVAVVERVAKDNSWVIVSEVTGRGVFRSVRYTGASLPRAYLRFKRTNGSTRGSVTALAAKRGSIAVRGVAIDPDRPKRGVRIRVKVTQNGRTWIRTTARPTPVRFTRNFSLPGLRAGRATVRVIARDTPGTRGKSRTLDVRRVIVR